MTSASSRRQPVQVGMPAGAIDQQAVYGSSDTSVTHTYASYYRGSIPELDSYTPSSSCPADGDGERAQDVGPVPKPHHSKQWSLCIPIPIPSASSPGNLTLESLMYDINYTSSQVGLNAFCQTDILLSNGSEAVEGIITDPHKELTFYTYNDEHHDSMVGYTQPVFNGMGSILHSKPMSQVPDTTGSCRFVGYQRIYPNARIGGGTRSEDTASGTGTVTPNPDCFDHLYLFFLVWENSCAEVSRNIIVDVVAMWRDDISESSVEVPSCSLGSVRYNKGKGVERSRADTEVDPTEWEYEGSEDTDWQEMTDRKAREEEDRKEAERIHREETERDEAERIQREEMDRVMAERMAKEERDLMVAAEAESRREAELVAREEVLQHTGNAQAYRLEMIRQARFKAMERRAREEAEQRRRASEDLAMRWGPGNQIPPTLH